MDLNFFIPTLRPAALPAELVSLGLKCYSSESDPLNLFCLQEWPSEGFKSAAALVKAVRTLVWSIESQQKRNLLTLFLLTDQVGSSDVRKIRNDVSEIARIRVVDRHLGEEQLRQYFSNYLVPATLPQDKTSHQLDAVANLSNDLASKSDWNAEILRYARRAQNPEDLAAMINTALDELLKGVRNAAS